MEKTTAVLSSTSKPPINKYPSTICHGYTDINGLWNNGFICPVQNFIQFVCCDKSNYPYCCSPNRYLAEINSYNEQNYIFGRYQPSNQLTIDHNQTELLFHNSITIHKQFQLFQKLFIPIFLLCSCVLFVIGIAIWFWLYKHKVFYAIQEDSFTKQNRTLKRLSKSMDLDLGTKRKHSINLTMEENFRSMSFPTSEV